MPTYVCSAYIGTDFYVNMVENERRGRRETLERLRAAGNRRGVAALEKIDDEPTKWTVKEWVTRVRWSMATDPVSPNVLTKLILPLLLRRNPDYSLVDAWYWLKGFGAVRDAMFDQFMRFDARPVGTHIEVPFYLFQGADDVGRRPFLRPWNRSRKRQRPARGVIRHHRQPVGPPQTPPRRPTNRGRGRRA